MEAVVKQVGCYATFMKVVKGVKVGTQSSRNPTDQLDELVLSAAKKDYHLELGAEAAGQSVADAIAAVEAAVEAAKEAAASVKEEGVKEEGMECPDGIFALL